MLQQGGVSLHFITLCSAAGLRGHRQTKESREHEQLQLQSCKGGNSVISNNTLLCCCTIIKAFLQKYNLFLFSSQILLRLSKLCVQEGLSGRKSRKQQQRLLRNMGAHTVVLELLQIPYEKVSIQSFDSICVSIRRQTVTSGTFALQGEDLRMQDIMKLAHQFLQNFCAGNPQNQTLLHKHINLFLNPGVCYPS